MATQSLPPPPLSSSPSAPAWLSWFHQLWTILARVQLTATGPYITQGIGAPTNVLPNGSLYLRTDGAGPSLYVRQNGAWVAK